MSIANKILPIKTRWSPQAIKKLRGERTLAEFSALIGACAELVESWENGTNPDFTYAERLTDLARNEFERDSNWQLAGSGILNCDDLEDAIRKIRDEGLQAFERKVV